jgi:hypothetical protein
VFKLITYGYEPPVTDVSEANKQYNKKCSATVLITSKTYPKTGTNVSDIQFSPTPEEIVFDTG